MSQRKLRTRTRVNYTEEKIDKQSAFEPQKKTTRKRKEAANAASQGSKHKRARTGRARKARRSPTEEEANVPEEPDNNPEVTAPGADVRRAPDVEGNADIPRAEDNPVRPTRVSRGIEAPQSPSADNAERATLFRIATEVRLNIYRLITLEEPVYKDLPGYRTGAGDTVNKAVWWAHIVGRLGTLGNRRVLNEAQTVLNSKDRKLDPTIWINWKSLSQLPRLLQMITEAFRLEQRYKNAHIAQPNQEADWERVERLWDVIIDIPVHEYLNPEPQWQQDFLARLRAGVAHLRELRHEDFGMMGPSSIIGVSASNVKLLQQFLASTLARLRRPQNRPAVLEIRALMGPPEASNWRIRESLLLYAYFKAFRSAHLVIKFTVLSNNRSGSEAPGDQMTFQAQHTQSLNLIDVTDRGDFVIERELATPEESRRLS